MNREKIAPTCGQLKRLAKAFSPETLTRFQEIAQQLQAHEKNIAYLQWVATAKKTLKKAGVKKGRKRDESKLEDRARLPKTLLNLRQQMAVLAYEWEVLKRYGR